MRLRRSGLVALALVASGCRCKPADTEPGPIVFVHHLRCSLALPPGYVSGAPMPDHLFEALLLGDGAVRTLAVKEAGASSAEEVAATVIETSKASQPGSRLSRRAQVKGGVLLVFEVGTQHETWFVTRQHGRTVKAWTGLQDPSLDAEAEEALSSVSCSPLQAPPDPARVGHSTDGRRDDVGAGPTGR